MTTRTRRIVLGATAFAASLVFLSGFTSANGNRVYRVTVTNLTRGQVFSPPVLATHKSSVGYFTPGQPASDELAQLAEDGNGAPLATLLGGLDEVFEVQAAAAPIPPGAVVEYTIESRRRFRQFSIAGMLVNTNDAFFAVNGGTLPRHRGESVSFRVAAYDAGSEGNNEDCGFVPGPACPGGSGNARDVGGAEGFVYVGNGIHGIADLAPDAYDWRNPTALVTIRRVR